MSIYNQLYKYYLLNDYHSIKKIIIADKYIPESCYFFLLKYKYWNLLINLIHKTGIINYELLYHARLNMNNKYFDLLLSKLKHLYGNIVNMCLSNNNSISALIIDNLLQFHNFKIEDVYGMLGNPHFSIEYISINFGHLIKADDTYVKLILDNGSRYYINDEPLLIYSCIDKYNKIKMCA